MNGDLTFDTNDLQTYSPATDTGIITNLIDHTSIPEKIAELYIKADADGSSIPAINYPSKKVTIGGVIKGSSQADLDSRIDTFKGYFNGKNKNLDITYGADEDDDPLIRRYIATANTVSVTRQQKVFWAEFTVEFICTQPFGVDTTATVITNTANHTSSSLNVTPTIGGSAPVQYPVFTITIDALTGTGDYVQISNDNNGQDMLLYGLGLEAGDVIVIDCFNRTVTVNGDMVDYNGAFLELEPGANSLTYADGFATRTVDILINYYKRWL